MVTQNFPLRGYLICTFSVAGSLAVKNLLSNFIGERSEICDTGGGTCGLQGGRRILDGQDVSKRFDCHLPAVYRTLRYISRADLPFC
jgi:hypothetical protein